MSSYEAAPATLLLATHCACCGRPLVDAVSVETGVGPDCRARHGYLADAAPEARAEANALVHAIAVEQTGPGVLAATARLAALGFVKLAARVADRLGQGAVSVRRHPCGERLIVVAPYDAEAVAAWRGLPGRRWEGGANVVPCGSEAALRALLAAHYPLSPVSLDGTLLGLGASLSAPLCAAPSPVAPAPRKVSQASGPGFPNRYPGACAACGASVTDGAGTTYKNGGWHCCCAAPTCRAACGLDRPEPTPPAGPKGPSPSDAARVRATAAGLYPYQADGAAWLAGRARALLADDMGVGKTAQVLAALPAGARAIVVCPASLKYVWRDEAKRWRPDLTVRVCSGKGSLVAPVEGEVVVVNYDVVTEADAPKAAGCHLVLDEAHAVKNYKAKRTVALRALATAAAASWLLTGTPMLGRPTDLWGVLGCGDLGRAAYGSWGRFVDDFGGCKDKWGQWHWSSRPSPEAATKLRSVMLRRTKAEVLPSLPPIRERVLTHNGISSQLRAAMDAIEALQEERKAPRGQLPAFEEMSAVRAMLAAERVPVVLELVGQHEESETPLVVFSAHRAPVDALRGREGWAVITGDESPEERADAVRRFQAGELRGIGATIKAGGVGLTLTHASDVLMVDQEWTPALNAQAIDRVRRIGQEAASILVTRLVSDHALDARVDAVLAAKRTLIDATVDGVAS